MRSGSRILVMLGCVAAGCVDTRLPHAQRQTADAGLWAWDAGPGSEKPPQAHPPLLPGRASAADPGSAQGASAAAGSAPRLPPSAADASAPGAPVEPAMAGAGGRKPAANEPGSEAPAPEVPSPTRYGELVISELMVDPKSLPDTQGEWFELYNPGARELELRDCLVDDGAKSLHALSHASGMGRIQAGAYFTIARHADPGFEPDAVTSLSLTNKADSLALVCGGVEIDRVAYDTAAGFIIKPGVSLALDPEHLDAQQNDAASAWCEGRARYGGDFGSPGAPNPDCDGTEQDAGAP